MSIQVGMGATLLCTFGMAPSSLMTIPKGPPVMAGGVMAATIMDYMPIANIPPFGMCFAPTNPMFIAATTAALGVPTPVPCIPVTTSPWMPGSPMVHVNNMPTLNNTSTNMCMWLGVISVTVPGQFTVMVP